MMGGLFAVVTHNTGMVGLMGLSGCGDGGDAGPAAPDMEITFPSNGASCIAMHDCSPF